MANLTFSTRGYRAVFRRLHLAW